VEPQDLPSFAEDTISPRVLCITGKNSMQGGKLNNEPAQGEALLDRINKLEQMLGKLTLENEFLKKALQNVLKEQEKKRVHCRSPIPCQKCPKGVRTDENRPKHSLS